MKKILLTGSGGFIICNFIRQAIFNKLDYSFVSIDKIKWKKTLDNIYTNKNHKFYIGDITNEHLIDIIFEVEKPDIVIHGADESEYTDDFVMNNIHATQVLLQACNKWKIERFIYLSTDKVYGSHQNDQEQLWTELATINPIDTYGASKASAELLIKASNINYNILRLCSNYGPRQNVGKLIPIIIKKLAVNEQFKGDADDYDFFDEDNVVRLFNKGRNLRDWVYVQDTCSAIALILEKGNANDIYNISAGHEFSDTEIFQRVCNALNTGHNQVKLIDSSYKEKNYFRRASNSDKLRSLGWSPEYKFKDGLAAAVQWNLDNKWHLRD